MRLPWQKRRKMLSAHLSINLRKKYKRRSFPIRKGNSVKVLRGDFKGEEGKVTKVDYKRGRIYIEGIKRERVNGSEVLVPIHPSKVMITKLNLSDKFRERILKRK